jgi:hypothetical protein
VKGTGNVTIILLNKGTTPDGKNLTSTVQTCSLALPDATLTGPGAVTAGVRDPAVCGLNCEGRIQIQLPDSEFDKISRTFPAKGTQTGYNPGDTMSYSATVGLLGLKAGTSGAWDNPATAWAPDCANNCTPSGSFVQGDLSDDDNDTFPGITATPLNGDSGSCVKPNCNYADPPSTIIGGSNAVADQVYIVSRNELTISGPRATCTQGTATVKVGLFDNHVVGCHIKGGSACNSAQVQFIDSNRTKYVVAGDGTAKVVQLTADANGTCAQARSANYNF